MTSVPSSLVLALGQLADGRVLRILLKTLGVSLVLFAAVAWAGWYSLDALLDWAGLDEGLFAGAGTLREVAALLMALLGLWLAWRIVAMVLRRPAFHGVAVLGGLPGEGLRFVLEADGVVGGELGEAAAPVLEVLPQICGVESHGA